MKHWLSEVVPVQSRVAQMFLDGPEKMTTSSRYTSTDFHLTVDRKVSIAH